MVVQGPQIFLCVTEFCELVSMETKCSHITDTHLSCIIHKHVFSSCTTTLTALMHVYRACTHIYHINNHSYLEIFCLHMFYPSEVLTTRKAACSNRDKHLFS